MTEIREQMSETLDLEGGSGNCDAWADGFEFGIGNAEVGRNKFATWILHESEAFIGKASKGDVVELYFEPLATQHMKASDSPEG